MADNNRFQMNASVAPCLLYICKHGAVCQYGLHLRQISGLCQAVLGSPAH